MAAPVPVPQSVVLLGMGGVGKTSVALEFAHISRSRRDIILWFQSETLIALAHSFSQAARILHLPAASEGNHTHNRLLVLEVLQRISMSESNSKIDYSVTQSEYSWLLVFDNVEDADHVRQYMPNRGNGAILITSRKPTLGYDLTETELSITPFSAQEGTECIVELATWQRGVKRDNKSASELNEKLGGLPLGIIQMVALMRAKAMSIKDFITLYEKGRKKLHGPLRRGIRCFGYNHDLSTVWQLAFRSLDGSPSAMSLLGVLCFLSPSSIPQALFKSCGDTDGKCTGPMLPFCKGLVRYKPPCLLEFDHLFTYPYE